MRDDILGKQAAQQGLDRIRGPIPIRPDAFGNILRGERCLIPEHFHHGMFSAANTFGHATLLILTTAVIVLFTIVVKSRWTNLILPRALAAMRHTLWKLRRIRRDGYWPLIIVGQ
jgi:hypothetical protein